jgi:hypothetical protein
VPGATLGAVHRLPVQQAPEQVVICSETWSPAKVLGNGDPRTLGVAVEQVRLLR